MHLNLVGAIVKAVWDNLPHHFPLIELDAFVVMPNHVHETSCKSRGWGTMRTEIMRSLTLLLRSPRSIHK